MADRIKNQELARCLAARMKTDERTADAWIDATVEELYRAIKSGACVTLTGFGSFYVRPQRMEWVFKFNPAQRLRAALGWSSSYKGKH
jgi:hypothetical protein